MIQHCNTCGAEQSEEVCAKCKAAECEDKPGNGPKADEAEEAEETESESGEGDSADASNRGTRARGRGRHR